MLNNKKPLAGDNPFDKQKLAEEARREQESIKKAQSQREKSVLSMQINNRKNELERARIELRTKENRLNILNANLEALKRDILGAKSKISQEESAITAIKSKPATQTKNTGIIRAGLDKLKRMIDTAKAEKLRDESSLREEKVESSAVERRIVDLERELNITRSEFEKLKMDIANRERDLNIKRSEIDKLESEYKSEEAGADKKIAPDRTADNAILTKRRELEKLKADLFIKERQESNSEIEDRALISEVNRMKVNIAEKEREINALSAKLSQIK